MDVDEAVPGGCQVLVKNGDHGANIIQRRKTLNGTRTREEVRAL